MIVVVVYLDEAFLVQQSVMDMSKQITPPHQPLDPNMHTGKQNEAK